MRRVLLFVLLLIGLPAAVSAQGGTPTPSPAADDGPDWLAVNDFLYQLQRFRFETTLESAFDLLIVDIGAAGNSAERIAMLQDDPDHPKLVLCYMSIGEAEDYRFYWQPEWRQEPPGWLGDFNDDWGSWKVHYWDEDWQAIIFEYLDQILALGFDGMYLDIVDAYEYYEERGRETAAREMVDFILALTDYARQHDPHFGVFPQNAEALGADFPEYLAAMTGLGVEDLYYGYPMDHRASPPEWTAEREVILDRWVAAGKLVLTTDYTRWPEQIADTYERSRARGYVPYVADRSLGRFRINPGFEPD